MYESLSTQLILWLILILYRYTHLVWLLVRLLVRLLVSKLIASKFVDSLGLRGLGYFFGYFLDWSQDLALSQECMSMVW